MSKKVWLPKNVRDAFKLNKKPKLKPKPCPICGELFQPKTRQGRICGKKECKKELKRRDNAKRAKIDYSKGKVFTLDMSKPESEWTWQLEERGD